MIENVMHHLGGVGMYGIISICIFLAFFLCMLLWAFRLKRSYLNSMSELPLDGEIGRQSPSASSQPQPLSRHE